jgi:DtxR family Mn-dependent transcriptional regulator
MSNADHLTASLQCYLAAILQLESEQKSARPSMIAEKCGVHRSSVTGALRALADRAMIRYEPYGSIILTPQGKEAGGAILARCSVIREFLVEVLDIEEETAHDAACRMQPSVPTAIIARIAERFSVRPGPPPG